MNGQAQHFCTFGPFVLDAGQRVLRRDGKPIPLAPKAIDTLLVLVRNAGQLMEKEELMKEVWPDTFVEEGNLTKNIFVLRKTLGNGDNGREYIETVPTRGYRFVAPVTDGSSAPAAGVTDDDGSATRTEPQPSAVPIAALGTHALPVLPAPAKSYPGARAERWPWRLTAAVLGAVVVAGLAGWIWLSPLPQSVVLKTTHITHFGRVEGPSRLVTDGTRIYFVQRRGGSFTLAAVPVEGGEPVAVPTPFPNTALYGISPDHSQLLLGSFAGGDDEASLWILPTTGGRHAASGA